MRISIVAIACTALAMANATAAPCGDLVKIATHGGTTTGYAFGKPSQPARAALVLLPGGGGHIALDEKGCPHALVGNSLVRSVPLFHGEGFATALVDAPSDHPGDDGLAGFRVTPEHAEDLGKVIADVRARTKLPVWLIGTSRGTISAVNAASRLSGAAAPDGLVLTSALMSGGRSAQKPWVSQTVFDLDLAAIRVPVLVVGHAEDKCVRSPASLMGTVVAKTEGAREQVALVTGGPGSSGPAGIAVCEGRSPHGFLQQEAEVAAGIARFIHGGTYP